jgi:hypothetical protein
MTRRLQNGVTSTPRILVLSALAILAGSACSGDPGPAEPRAAGTSATAESTASTVEADRIHAYIYANYAPSDVRHSFQTPMGDDIDCIDFYAQPSVKDALQRGVRVSDQGPPNAPRDLTPKADAPPPGAFDGEPDESGNARACPSGSVPYVRRSVERIQRAGGLDALLARTVKPHSPAPSPPGPGFPGAADYGGYSHATLRHTAQNLGGGATMSLYNPWYYCPLASGGGCNCGGSGQAPCDHTLSQVWSFVGDCVMNNGACTPAGSSVPIESVEVGWIVDYGDYLDTNTHLFVFGTSNGYQNGCYNTYWGQSNASSGSPCAWTSLNGAYAPNMALSPTGTWQTPGVAPPEITLITYNPGNGDWYVAVNGSWIGYFSLPYTGQMKTSAAVFQTGGEIYEASEDPQYDNNKPSDDQTCMGACYDPANSGPSGQLGYKVSAYAYDNYYLLQGSGSQMCSGAPCCSGGLCWTPASDTPTVTKGSESGLGVANGSTSPSLPSGSTNSGYWGPYFYFGGR